MPPASDLRIFISYSHKDQRWLEKLEAHLKPLVAGGKLAAWADTSLVPGAKWKQEIAKTIQWANIAILLVTPDFLASDFIAQNELPPLLKAAEQNNLTSRRVGSGPATRKTT
jgi:internalin A